MPDCVDLEQRLAAALSARRGRPVRVSGIRRFHGGAARETSRFDATDDLGTRGLVVRRDPPSTLIETSRAVEYHALGRAHAAGLPVPEPLFLDAAGTELGTAGFVMAELPSGRAPGLFEADPYGAHAARLGETVFTALGRLHAIRLDAADRAALPAQGPAARLTHWKAVIAADRRGPQPVAAAAIRWLERHCPPDPARPVLVHGDYRSGNLLVSDAGELLGLLDWEMAHIGDPHEDLAWACDPLWAHGDPSRPAAMLPFEAAVAAWQAASGLAFDRAHWNWWRLFAGVVGLAIWITSAKEVIEMRTVDPVLAFAGFYPYRFHNAQVAALLAELAA